MATREQPIELFMPPNMLKAKVGGGGFSGLDMAAIKRAEAAMSELQGEFAGWAASDVANLMAAQGNFKKNRDVASRAALLRAAHDMKGQAATFNFPLIARVAGSLSKLMGELPAEKELPSALVDAHVSAVHVIHREGLTDTDNKIALTLCTELEKQVAVVLKM